MMIGAKRKFGCDACNNNSESVARNDNFFQPHMKSQVTQKLVNQQNEDTMKEVELQTLSKLKSGVSHYYKLLKNPNNTNSEEKPMKRELLRPSSEDCYLSYNSQHLTIPYTNMFSWL